LIGFPEARKCMGTITPEGLQACSEVGFLVNNFSEPLLALVWQESNRTNHNASSASEQVYQDCRHITRLMAHTTCFIHDFTENTPLVSQLATGTVLLRQWRRYGAVPTHESLGRISCSEHTLSPQVYLCLSMHRRQSSAVQRFSAHGNSPEAYVDGGRDGPPCPEKALCCFQLSITIPSICYDINV
jgi:hypothetical protein